MLKATATVYGLSTEGYRIAVSLCSKGIPTTIIDENLQMGMQLKAETVKNYPTIKVLTDEEALVGLKPIEAAISGAKYIFFTPKIRRIGEDLKGELNTRMKEVGKYFSKGTVLFCNLPTSLGGNLDNIELLRRVSGLEPREGFQYLYAPIDPNTKNANVLGYDGAKPAKDIMETMVMAGMKTQNLTSLECAELIHFQNVMGKSSDSAVTLESYRRIEDRGIRIKFKRTPGYRDVYLDELVENLLDLRLLAGSLVIGEPLLHIATGLIRSSDGYIRYLVDEIRATMKSKDLKASKTKMVLVWSLDRYEMRGERLMTMENLVDKLRDYVGEIMKFQGTGGTVAQEKGWQDIFLGSRASLLIACSRSDFEVIGKLISNRLSPEMTLMKGNLLCEVVS